MLRDGKYEHAVDRQYGVILAAFSVCKTCIDLAPYLFTTAHLIYPDFAERFHLFRSLCHATELNAKQLDDFRLRFMDGEGETPVDYKKHVNPVIITTSGSIRRFVQLYEVEAKLQKRSV